MNSEATFKKLMPEWAIAIARRRTRDSFFFGLLFDLFFRQYRTEGCRFEIPRQMFPLNWRAHFFFDKYELDERKLVKQYLRPDDRVLELGSCIGVVSCIINQMLAMRSAHTVVEANPFVLPWLYRNRLLNNCEFEVIHTAVGQNRSESFSIEANVLFGGANDSNVSQQVKVIGMSFPELIQKHGPYTALVMDIEGAELSLLEAAGEWLSSFRLVLFETHPYILGESGVRRCGQALERGGFEMVAKSGAVEAWRKVEFHIAPNS